MDLGEIRLIIDGSKVGFGHQLWIICLEYRKRAIPIAWTWVKHVRGHSSAWKQLALLAYVRKLIPAESGCFSGRRLRIWLCSGLASVG